MHALVARRKAETLTPGEQTELIALSDRLEEANAQRIGYLAELARVRHTTLGDFCKRTSHLVLLVPEFCSWPPPNGGRLEGGNRGIRCAPVSHGQRHCPPPGLPPLGGGRAWEHLFWKSPYQLGGRC